MPVHPCPEFSAVSHPISGVFGESQWFDTITMENASPSPPPLEPWPSCSMFMVATEPWPSGTSSRSATTGEQLNTPQPANGDIGGFDFENIFGGRQETSQRAAAAAAAAKVNLTNVFSKNDINGITKIEGEDFNNNGSNNGKGNDSSLQLGGSIEPLFSNYKESVITAGFDSWEFEPCPEETLLSPISYVATPHHSTGVASPGSSSGDTNSPDHRRSLPESETCVDFNSFLCSPSSPIVEASEEDDLCAGNLHEEIEQLSNSFYCTSNSLVSVNANGLASIDDVSPSILKLLQEEDQPLTAAAAPRNVSLHQQPTSNLYADGTRQPSVAANSYFSDATNDGEDEQKQQQQHVERKQEVVATAAAPCYADDETLDVKTQTQLEHNYTIQLPSEASNPAFKKQQTTVKEANLALLAKARETLKPQTTTTIPALHQQRRPIQQVHHQSVKRQLFQRMKSRMASTGAPAADPIRKVPSLKLKIVNAAEAMVVDDDATTALTATQVVLNTPDLTENLLDLEDEFLIKEDNFDLLKYIDSATGYDVIHSPKEEKPDIRFPEPAVAPTSSTASTTTICGPTLSDLFNPAKRKLPAITIESLDELTASTNATKRSRGSYAATTTSSTTSSVCGDNASETSARPAKRRGRPPKPVSSVRDRSEYEHLSEADMRYREQRDKNNEASRKSRINRKDRESKLEQEAQELIQKYEVLEGKERELIQECARWRKAVMRLALL